MYTKKPRPLYLASKNIHKVNELKSMIDPTIWDLRSCVTLSPNIKWEESGTTFAENAKIKALAVRQYTEEAILADDSGLEVEALNGAPGIYSSRYAGQDGDDQANNRKLLKELNGVSNRKAQFVCCLVFIDANGKNETFEGKCKGKIIEEEKGIHGFGYDPLFIPEGKAETLAEISDLEKNQISHRKSAFDQWNSSQVT